MFEHSEPSTSNGPESVDEISVEGDEKHGAEEQYELKPEPL